MTAATAIAPAISRYAAREQAVRDLFAVGTRFSHQGRSLEVLACGKPHVGGGETKTDVYIATRDIETGEATALKISFKLHSAEFIENKLTATRAREVLGVDYEQVLRDAASALNIDKRAFANKRKATHVLGYRLDIMVKARNRAKVSPSYHPVALDTAALMRIYAGSDSSNNKRDAYVTGYNNDQLVPGAGIADYILFDDQFHSAQQVIDRLIPIAEYVADNPMVYLAFKAVNFRQAKHDAGLLAWDGNRPLAYAINWTATTTGDLVGTLNLTEIFYHHANARGQGFAALLG